MAMRRPLVLMVPGQGVQYAGMFAGLYRNHSGFRNQLDSILNTVPATLTGRLLAVIQNDPSVKESELSDCRLTHPLVFAVHYALAQTLRLEGVEPDYLLGYSLGELTASAINGSLSSQTAMKLAVETGAWVTEHTPERHMMAILAAPDIQQACYPYFESITVACRNYTKHFVITGTPGELEAIASELHHEGIHSEILPINRGFHSSAMDPFKQQAAQWDATIEWNTPLRAPLISCALGNIASLSDLRNNHLGILHHNPVHFSDTFRGVEAEWSPHYVDLSPTGTLAAFARQLLPPSRRSALHTVQSRFGDGLRQFEAFLTRWAEASA